MGKINVPEAYGKLCCSETYKPLPKYPATTRDLSIVCDDDIPAALLEKTISKAVGSILEKVTLFDVYKGEQIEKRARSLFHTPFQCVHMTARLLTSRLTRL